ncbi:MAG: glycosyltransferase family 2 protein [Candidatus Aquicultorales bacterium]
MRLSIVTPSFNQADFIEQTIRSVLEQGYPDVEHIVIDGGSTDGTLDILKKYETDVKWISEPDKGQSHAINKGFAMARGEIIGWINSDDYYFPGAFHKAVDCLNSHPEVGLVYGYCAKVDEKGKEIEVLRSPEFDRGLLYKNPCLIWQQSVFFRKALLDTAGLLDDTLHYAMDYDLWIRMAKEGDFKLIPEILAAYRFSRESKSVASDQSFWLEVDTIFDRYEEIDIPWLYRALHKSKLVHGIWNRIRSPFLLRFRDRMFGFWRASDSR